MDIKSILGPVKHIVQKEFIELRRTRLIVFLLVSPILMSIVFGYVATTDVTHVRTLICDEDNTVLSRNLADKFNHTEYFRITAFTRTPTDIQKIIGGNKAKICIRIPKRFEEYIKKGQKSPVQVLVDGTDSNSAGISMSRAIQIISAFSNEIFADKITAMHNIVGTLPSVVMEERVWYNPELLSAYDMVPGVLALILAVVTMIVTSLALVREKESGNIEQMLVSPIKPWQIIAGKIIPYIFISFVDIITIVVISLLLFHISFRGSFLLLLALSFFVILTNLGLGILISTISTTQQQGMLSAIFFMLPQILLSGFIFPIKNMPGAIQLLSYIVPMRYYLIIVRGIFLKDMTFTELLPQTLALFAFGIIVFTLAIKEFRKTVE